MPYKTKDELASKISEYYKYFGCDLSKEAALADLPDNEITNYMLTLEDNQVKDWVFASINRSYDMHIKKFNDQYKSNKNTKNQDKTKRRPNT